MFAVFARIKLDFALGHDKINLTNARVWINSNAVNHADFEGPSRKVANKFARLSALITPAQIAKTSGDMGVDA